MSAHALRYRDGVGIPHEVRMRVSCLNPRSWRETEVSELVGLLPGVDVAAVLARWREVEIRTEALLKGWNADLLLRAEARRTATPSE